MKNKSSCILNKFLSLTFTLYYVLELLTSRICKKWWYHFAKHKQRFDCSTNKKTYHTFKLSFNKIQTTVERMFSNVIKSNVWNQFTLSSDAYILTFSRLLEQCLKTTSKLQTLTFPLPCHYLSNNYVNNFHKITSTYVPY